jgi:hypothetical protein
MVQGFQDCATKRGNTLIVLVTDDTDGFDGACGAEEAEYEEPEPQPHVAR